MSNHRDPTVHRVIVDTVTSNDVRCGDVTHGDVTSVKDSRHKCRSVNAMRS